MKKTETKVFYNSEEFNKIWDDLPSLGSLGEGECRRLNRQFVIKKIDNINKKIQTEDYFLKFKDLDMKVYIFAKKVFYIDNILKGYISKYSPGKNLSFIDRNKINFSELIEGCKEVYMDNYILSEKGIESLDVPFNILYRKGHFSIIDTCDYKYTDKESQYLYETSIKVFNSTILEFLAKSTFYQFVKSSKELSKEYKETENGADIALYIELLRKRLSEYLGFEVKYIRDAKSLMSSSEYCLHPDFLIEEEEDPDYSEIDYQKRLLQKYNDSHISMYY